MQNGCWALEELEFLYRLNGGLIDCHRHIDRHNSNSRQWYEKVMHPEAATGSSVVSLEDKWDLMDVIKASDAYRESLLERMRDAVATMEAQGIRACRSYIDVDEVIGGEAFRVAAIVRAEAAARGFRLQLAAYPIKGLDTEKRRDLFYAIAKSADLIGILPSRGRAGLDDHETVEKNLRLYFETALMLGKPLDMQIDQKNNPREHECLLLSRVAREFRDRGYAYGITATHATSLGAQPDAEIKAIARAFYDLDITVDVCPGANISTQEDRSCSGPLRNAMAPVRELLDAGVPVGIGTDNVSDIYMPFCDGNFRSEIGKFIDAVRWQGDISALADVATTNGRLILGLPLPDDRE